jgi:hypothetical protein
MHFLFPRDPEDPKEADSIFAEQRRCLADAGHATSLFADGVLHEGRPLRGIPEGSTVVYRGWMLSATEYDALVTAIEAAGATAITSPSAYLVAHHLPNWYPLLAEFTAETRIYPEDADLTAELRLLGWEAYFLKDFVKSLKAPPGPIARRPEDAPAIVAAMREFRGDIEGGICVRRVEPLVPESERRYFVWGGVPFAPSPEEPVPDIVRAAAERVPSPFFSVDVARRSDGVLRIVEVGDGQVSDLVGWTASAFVRIWPPAANPASTCS